MNNKMRKSILAMALIPVGVMFMAAKPGLPPKPNNSNYEDFTYTFVEKGSASLDEDGEKKRQTVVFDFENTGDSFVEYFRIETNYSTYSPIFTLKNDDSAIFLHSQREGDLLAPHSTGRGQATLVYPSSEEFDEAAGYAIKAVAYNEKVDVTVNNVSFAYVKQESYARYLYNANFDLNYVDDHKNHLYIVFTIEYEGVEYNFYERTEEQTAVVRIETTSLVDENNITIKNIQLVRGEKIVNLQGFLNIMVTIIIACGAGVILLSGVIALIIILSIRRSRRKNQLTMSDINK